MDNKKWYQIKEQAAGEKRLILTWYVYKILGRTGLDIITFFVSLSVFIFSKNIRLYSKKYLTAVSRYSDIKPTLINQFRHILSYASTLADKIEVFSGNYNADNIKFNSSQDKSELVQDIEAGNGIFFLCNHLGNIEVLRSFLINSNKNSSKELNVFMSKTQSQIFNSFIRKISKEEYLNIYTIEDIGIDTSIRLKDSLNRGGFVFIAGDRTSDNEKSSTFSTDFLGKKMTFPVGSFKLAQLMQVPIYFITAIKQNNKNYTIHIQKHVFSTLENIEKDYVNYLEKLVIQNPLEFYHFYDFLN